MSTCTPTLEVVRTVFSDLSDAASLREFMTTRVEPLLDSKTKQYDADAMLVVLMDEWHRRVERNVAQLKAGA